MDEIKITNEIHYLDISGMFSLIWRYFDDYSQVLNSQRTFSERVKLEFPEQESIMLEKIKEFIKPLNEYFEKGLEFSSRLGEKDEENYNKLKKDTTISLDNSSFEYSKVIENLETINYILNNFISKKTEDGRIQQIYFQTVGGVSDLKSYIESRMKQNNKIKKKSILNRLFG